MLPLLLFGVAAATDLLDGWAARRRAAASVAGQLFDHATDVLFLGSSLVLFAACGRVSWWVPAAVAVAALGYGHVLWRRLGAPERAQDARTALGHAAGVVNYGLVGLLAGDLAVAGSVPGWLVRVAGLTTVGINVLAVVGRLHDRTVASAHRS